jgi:stringent starvation protein B
MPTFIKYRRCETESVRITLETLQNGDILLNVASAAYHLRKDTSKNIRYETLFCGGKQIIAERQLIYHFLQLEQ